jgi:hypothetical protein
MLQMKYTVLSNGEISMVKWKNGKEFVKEIEIDETETGHRLRPSFKN